MIKRCKVTKNATSKIVFPSFFLVIQALFMEEINIILMNENVDDEEDAIEYAGFLIIMKDLPN